MGILEKGYLKIIEGIEHYAVIHRKQDGIEFERVHERLYNEICE